MLSNLAQIKALTTAKPEEGKGDALCLKDGGFKIGEDGEAGRDNQEFLQLVGCSFTD